MTIEELEKVVKDTGVQINGLREALALKAEKNDLAGVSGLEKKLSDLEAKLGAFMARPNPLEKNAGPSFLAGIFRQVLE